MEFSDHNERESPLLLDLLDALKSLKLVEVLKGRGGTVVVPKRAERAETSQPEDRTKEETRRLKEDVKELFHRITELEDELKALKKITNRAQRPEPKTRTGKEEKDITDNDITKTVL